jgi:hypothetical protein
MFATEIEQAIETLRAETYANGGSTVSVIGKPPVTDGYMVGGEVTGLQLDMEFLHPDNANALWRVLSRYINEHFKLLTDGRHFLGAWIDQASGTLWIDVSERFNVREYAILVAEDRKEIAVWDVAKSEEIRLMVTEPVGQE